jgi:type I restriction enzyme, R subunit
VYAAKVALLLFQCPPGTPIVGESAQREFIALFGAILRPQNIPTSFDDFAGNEIFSERQARDYRSVYLDLYVVLMLVQKWRGAHGDGSDAEVRASIGRAVDAGPSLRNKKDLIEAFVDSVSVDGAIDEERRAFVRARREAELDSIITAERLSPEATRAFIATAFRDGAVQATGTASTKVVPPVSRCSPDGEHAEKGRRVRRGLQG